MISFGKILTGTILAAATMLAAVPASADVQAAATFAGQAVQAAPSGAFRSAELQAAYLQDIEGIRATLRLAELEPDPAARGELVRDALASAETLVSRSDGCARGGGPDADDWLTVCEVAAGVHAALAQLSADIRALLP